MIAQLRKVEQFAGRIEEAKLRALADPLTGLAGRRAGEAILQHRLESGATVTLVDVALLDLKTWNEQGGSSLGDEILRAFSRLLVNQCSSYDLICRWAGSTFLLLGREGDKQPPDRAALQQNLSAPLALSADATVPEVQVKVAVGVAQSLPDDNLASLIARAETALRQGAASG